MASSEEETLPLIPTAKLIAIRLEQNTMEISKTESALSSKTQFKPGPDVVGDKVILNEEKQPLIERVCEYGES